MPRVHIENIAVLLTTCSAQLALLKTGYYFDRQDNDIDWHSWAWPSGYKSYWFGIDTKYPKKIWRGGSSVQCIMHPSLYRHTIIIE